MQRVTDRPGNWTGIYYEREAGGGLARFRVIANGGGRRESAWYPLTTALREMQDWRKDTAARLRLETPKKARASHGTFEGDARRYLKIAPVEDMYSRTRHIEWWIARFGQKRSLTITSPDVWEGRKVLIEEPSKFKQTKKRLPRGVDRHVLDEHKQRIPVFRSASQVNQHLRALSNFFAVMYPRAHNPVRGVAEVEEPEPEARGLEAAVVEAIFAKMPDRGRGAKGEDRPEVSIGKLWLQAEYYCGLTHAQLERVKPETEIDWTAGTFRTQRRRKGKGVPGEWKPIAPKGMAALKALHALGVLGTPRSASSFRKQFMAAARRAGYTADVTPYDLRHSYGSRIYEATGGDRQKVQQLLQQRDPRTTDRYLLTVKVRVLKRVTDRLHGGALPEEAPARRDLPSRENDAWPGTRSPEADDEDALAGGFE